MSSSAFDHNKISASPRDYITLVRRNSINEQVLPITRWVISRQAESCQQQDIPIHFFLVDWLRRQQEIRKTRVE